MEAVEKLVAHRKSESNVKRVRTELLQLAMRLEAWNIARILQVEQMKTSLWPRLRGDAEGEELQ